MRPIENEKPIVFVECDEDRVVIEKKDYGTSLFSSQYTTAFGILKRLVEIPNSNQCYPGQGNSRIIAFCGDRGAGKTSCMMSVRYAIENRDKEGIKEYLEANGLKTDELNADILKPIDPSYFDESHNILELVLGQMYLHFKEKAKKKGDDPLVTGDLEKVMRCFDEVKRSLSLISDSPQRMFDKLEELENLSVAMSLYDKLNALFSEYLKFMERNKILITIDDMDFNAEGAYRMCKFLQMYLNQPTCIVLISLKIAQLVSILGDDKNFKDARDENRRSEMSSKYVQKLIPISNRVQMVDMWSISERQFVIDRNGETTKPERIKDGVVRLIFQKTRYLFYNTKGEVSPIIPHSLRSFRQLLSLLCRMSDYEKHASNPAIQARNEGNKFQFKSYFYTEWIRTLEKDEDRNFAEQLSLMEDTKSFNKKIVSYLSKVPNLNDTAYNFGTITNPQNYTYNISTGDVFSIIRYLERSTESTGLKDLLFFIKSCYSIRLYECYDAMTDDSDTMFEEVPDGDVFKSDTWFRQTSKLQSLVNGNYFRYDAGSYITDNYSKNVNGFCYDKLLLSPEFYEFMDKLSDKVRAKMKDGTVDSDEDFKREYLLAEFLIMCTSYNHYGKYETKPDVNRRDSMPYYLEPIALQTDYVVFDITSLFSNMINIKYSYDRYEMFFDFFYFSDSHDWTLLGRLKKDIQKVRNIAFYQSIYHAIASDAIIRNSDVLMSLTEVMESNAVRFPDSFGGAVERYRAFLSGLYDIGMKTYRVEDDGKPYELKFSFINTISSMLYEVPEDKLTKILVNAKEMNEKSKTIIAG